MWRFILSRLYIFSMVRALVLQIAPGYLVHGAEGPLDVAGVQDSGLESELSERVCVGSRSVHLGGRLARWQLGSWLLGDFDLLLRLLLGHRFLADLLLAFVHRVLHSTDGVVYPLKIRHVGLAVDRAEARVLAQSLEVDELAVVALLALAVPVSDAARRGGHVLGRGGHGRLGAHAGLKLLQAGVHRDDRGVGGGEWRHLSNRRQIQE